MKVLSICKKRTDTYGYYKDTYGLMNSSLFISNYLNEVGYDATTVVATDYNELDKLVTENNPDVVIISALWVPVSKFQELLNIPRHSKRKWIVRVHSKFEFLSVETKGIEYIQSYKDLPIIVAANHQETAENIRLLVNPNTVYLPNIYYPVESLINKSVVQDKTDLVLGCFGAIRPMKNHLNQAVAAIKYAETTNQVLQFHVNNSHVEGGNSTLSNLRQLFKDSRHKLVEHPWLPHNEFVALVKEMDLGLQVSFTETFNIVAADFVMNGVCVVGSPQIDWLPLLFEADPNSVDAIAFKIDLILKIKQYGVNKFAVNKLKQYNEKAKGIWKEFLGYVN